MTQEKYEIADVEAFEDEDRIITEVRGREIAVFYVDGEFYSVLNYCIHEAGPLCEGALTSKVEMDDDGFSWSVTNPDRVIACPWHGWQFDIETGENTDDDSYSVPTYETTVEDGTVYVTV